MEQDIPQKTIDSKPESSPEDRASFASLAKEQEANKGNRELSRALKEKQNDDRMFLILGVFAFAISFVFLQLAFSKVEEEVTYRSLPFYLFFILNAGGLFLIVFGIVRFFLHRKRIKTLKE